jgi:predicted nucleotidyltransferase
MKVLVEMQFGSHLYGTSTPTSDVDTKSVFIPPVTEILLQRVQDHVSDRREKQFGEKNTPDDIDREAFALHRFLALVAEGQTMAVDMLFAPDFVMLREPAPVWTEIVANRSRLLSRQIAKFLTYCENQAKKYGIKGSRIHSVRNILAWFNTAICEHGSATRLRVAAPSLVDFIIEHKLQHAQIVYLEQLGHAEPLPHLEVCGLKAPYSISLNDARAIYQRIMDNYGARALMAETNQGVDWKAVSHAVRIGRQAVELLATGHVEFPRPEAAHLLAIKLGQVPYLHVADEIEQLLEMVKAAQATSVLPEEPDFAFIDSLVIQTYGRSVVEHFGLMLLH